MLARAGARRRARPITLALLLLATSTLAAPTRSSPLAVADDGRVFVVDPDQHTVARLRFDPAAAPDTVAGVLEQERPVGASPRTLALAGGWVFTADQGADRVTRRSQADLDAGLVTRDLGRGCAPFGVAPRPDGSGIVVACQGTSELVLLDLDLAVRGRVRLDWPQARGVAVSDAGEAYVTHYLTVAPHDDAHVSVVDLASMRVARVLAVPPDTTTCETQNSGQGVLNLVSAIALMPDDAPAAVRGQVWVGGTEENARSKGLFEREPRFATQPGARLFPSLTFAPFPVGATPRNVYKAGFHDVARSALWKLDRATGAIAGKVDIDQASNVTDVELSPDGAVAYVVDEMAHSYHVFSTLRGQDGDPTTLFAAPSTNGPGGVHPDRPCVSEALRSVSSEAPYRRAPQAQLVVFDPDPRRPTGDPAASFAPVATGVDFDAGHYLQTGANRMVAVPDGVGSAPIGVRLARDGRRAYVANYLARNVVAAAAAEPRAAGGAPANFRCTNAPATPCGTSNDCPAAGGVCSGPGAAACATDADCGANGPCVQSAQCVPLLLSEPVVTIAGGAGRCSTPPGRACTASDQCDPEPGFCNHDGARCAADADCGGTPSTCVAGTCGDDGSACRVDGDCLPSRSCVVRPACVMLAGDALDASLLDGKILFDTVARDGSTTNAIGLRRAAPAFDDRLVTKRVPGSVVSVAREASYVACSTCHADLGGHDGRTWDFSQFGSSLRNTIDLRGRSLFAPGRCEHDGTTCFVDAACGPGHRCTMTPALVPPNVPAADRARYFNPMLTAHWNGDRDEVEDFEHSYRSVLGAGDCDGAEYSAACQGALVQRSPRTSVDPVEVPGDLEAPSRNLRGRGGTNGGIRLTHVADFVYSLTAFPRNPHPADDPAAVRGRALFDDPLTRCASCHDGPAPGRQLFTDKAPNPDFDARAPARGDVNDPFVRHDVGTANLFDETDPFVVAKAEEIWQNGGNPPDVRRIPASRGPLRAYVTPVLNDVWNTAPYLHDGSAPSLLDVVRPCDTAVDDCLRAGRGRNLRIDGIERHGATGMLTPSQLDDLAAFLSALAVDVPVGSHVSVLHPGTLELDAVTLALPSAGASRVTVDGRLSGADVDPAGAVTVELGTPAGARMAILARALTMAGDESRRRGATHDAAAATKLALRRTGRGWRFRYGAKGPGVAVLRTGNPDLTVALRTPRAQFVRNRNLVERDGVLRLPAAARP
jgi:DNA-binding beta-propeller fold protein YncE